MGGGVAIASAVASLLTLVAAIVGLVFALGAGKPPSLVCTYTFKIHNKFTVWPSGTVHESNETWYSDDGRLAMWSTYADKWAKITYKDDLVYVVQSYFNRTLCTMLESASGCMGMTVGVKEMKWQHPCPGNESIMCDVWTGASKTYNETWYLLPDDEDGTSDGRVPMGYSTNTSDGYLLASFTRVTLDEPTDADAFETPAASKCFDMTDYGRKRSVASSPLRKRERFAINKLTGQREWNKLGDELLNPEGAMDEPEGGSTWTARRYPQFDGLTYRQLGERLTWPGRMSFMAAPLVEGADRSKLQVHRTAPKSFKSVGALPESFDATDEWSSCSKTVTKIRDQGNCGSCWAFGTTEVLADRKCIKDGSLSFNSPLSPQHVMDCYGENGCGGGYTDVAMLRFTQNGTVTDSCMPYREESRECRTTCSSTETIAYYKADTAYTLYGDSHPADTVTLMQQDLQTHGPLGVSFYVMSDFYDYESGVYQHKSSATNQGMHAVKLVGWGVEAGVPYWKVANSWGTSWGESGFFRIRRGINECGIEEMVFSCTAA